MLNSSCDQLSAGLSRAENSQALDYSNGNSKVEAMGDSKHSILGLPDEVLGAIIAEAMPKPSPGQAEHEVIFGKEYTRQSLIISHISSRWRNVSLSMPDLWPVRTNMHCDALHAFIARTGSSGMLVGIAEESEDTRRRRQRAERDAGFDTVLNALVGSFHRIKYLVARTVKWDGLQRFLSLGREARMERLTTLRVSFESTRMFGPSQYAPITAWALDWDMPVISSVHCQAIPLFPVFLPDAAPRIEFQNAFRPDLAIPLQSMPYRLFVRLDLYPPIQRGGIQVDNSDPSSGIIILSRLEELEMPLIGDEGLDLHSIHRPSNFNRLRCPNLQSLHLYGSNFAQPVSFSMMRDALASMKPLRTLKLTGHLVPLEDLVCESLFPNLEECTIWKSNITTSHFLSRVDPPGFPLTRFPRSLRKITLFNSTDRGYPQTPAVVLQLLHALHNRFDTDYERGMLQIIHQHNAKMLDALADMLNAKLNDDMAKRLDIVKD